MKTITITLLGLLVSFFAHSQKELIVLHPIVGDTIDQVEKKTYVLFPELQTLGFEYGQIYLENGKYTFKFKTEQGNQKVEVDSSDLQQYHINIEKLIAYYSYQENPSEQKPLVVTNQSDTCVLEMDFEYLNPEMRKKLRKDSYRYQRLKADAEEKGYWGTDKENYIKTSGVFFLILDKPRNK